MGMPLLGVGKQGSESLRLSFHKGEAPSKRGKGEYPVAKPGFGSESLVWALLAGSSE